MNAVGYFLHAEGEAKQVQFVERNNVVIENEHKTAILHHKPKNYKTNPNLFASLKVYRDPLKGVEINAPPCASFASLFRCFVPVASLLSSPLPWLSLF